MADTLAERVFVELIAIEYRAAVTRTALVGEARVDFRACALAAIGAERTFHRVENEEAQKEHGPLPEPSAGVHRG